MLRRKYKSPLDLLATAQREIRILLKLLFLQDYRRDVSSTHSTLNPKQHTIYDQLWELSGCYSISVWLKEEIQVPVYHCCASLSTEPINFPISNQLVKDLFHFVLETELDLACANSVSMRQPHF